MGKPTVHPTKKLLDAMEDIEWYATKYAKDRYYLTDEEVEFLVAYLGTGAIDKWRSDEYEDSQIPLMESLKAKGFVEFED